tara:strand:+ start:6935 stop:7708 length:774 start_codon:yes stop_codon:yes gene_type:complete
MLQPYDGFNQAVVTKRIDWTHNLFSLRVKVPFMPYTAGQFTKLAQYDEHNELIRRAYSIVNHPSDHEATGELEFLIISDPNGQLSPRLHRLAVGDELLVGNEPAGFMTLDEVPGHTRHLWLLSTGTAIGPYLAMLNDASIAKRFERVVLVNATRFEEELSYQEEITQLKQDYQERLTYVRIVSRELVSGALSGRIPMLLKSGELQRAVGIPTEGNTHFFYLCGNPSMVRDCSGILKELGFSKHLRRKPGQFSSENYW